MKKIKFYNLTKNANIIDSSHLYFQNSYNAFSTFQIFKIILIIFHINYIITNINKDNLRIKSLLKAKKYMNLCLNDILINKKVQKLLNKPNITAIIPAYNCEKTIKTSIRSIQNQNMNNIEIIIINDFSNDNTLKIIDEMAKVDIRIKIMNNNKNMGTLYSRCIGTLKAKGLYIFPLDDDDLFMNEDIFSNIFNEAEKGKYDIIGFHAIRGPNYKPYIHEMIDDIYHDNPNNTILLQPELGVHSIIKNGKYEINNIHIWGKCIKSEIYQNAVNNLGENKYTLFMSWAEDTSMVFILFNIAKSYKFISIYGIYHLMSEKTACYTQSIENKLFGEIFLLDILLDYSKEDLKKKKYCVMKILELTINDLFEKGIKNKKNKGYLEYVLQKFIQGNYTKEEKNITINTYKKIGFFNDKIIF